MPTYDYVCDTCKKKYELRETFSAESTHVCKKCGKGTAKRQISPPAIVFKGSGFYVTDSSKSSSTTLPSESSDGKSDNGKASDSASKTKKPSKTTDSSPSTPAATSDD